MTRVLRRHGDRHGESKDTSTKISNNTSLSWDLGQISSTMESTQSSARRPSRLTYKEASGMAATLSMLEDIGGLHAALKISTENDKDQLL